MNITTKQKPILERIKRTTFLLPQKFPTTSIYSGILIESDNLKQFGLLFGMIAVIEEKPINSGDLVAILQPDGFVLIGIFSIYKNMVFIRNQETFVFQKRGLKVLGVVIGKTFTNIVEEL